MIYDRKYTDITRAKQIYSSKIQKFETLTAEETEIINRAFFNLTALNRITDKMEEIWSTIVLLGGTQTECDDVRTWSESEIFKHNNFESIIDNISPMLNEMVKIGIDAGNLKTDYNKLARNQYSYSNLNNLEKLLYDIGAELKKFQERFAYQIGDVLYIIGAYGTSQIGGELTIE